MLLTLTLTLQLAAATAADLAPLTVRSGDRVREVPTITHPQGGVALRADLLAEALGGHLVAHGSVPWRYRLEIGSTGVDIETGSALVITAEDTVPLRGMTFRKGVRVYVPMSLATDLLPRIGAGVLYDVAKTELRRFTTVTTTSRPASGATSRRASAPAAPAPASAPASAKARALRSAKQHVVVVDAGHGGPDNGMTGPIGAPRTLYEKHVTLAVARALEEALERRGITVVMTRTRDTLIALSDRGKIANKANGDLFMSIHVNAANPRWNNPGGARGYETYFLAEAKTEDERRVAAMENEAIRFETSANASHDDPLGFIIRDMAQNEHLRESAQLAELVQAGMKEVHPGPSRGVKQAGFRVLVTAFMPAVLVEIGFGSNRLEASYMSDPAKQRELAENLADAAVRYLAQYERKVGGP